ncbi:MAG: NADH-quinone oxidoreductase subunit H [Elusimicrobia bacterium]|nr:NADH-quinone oxidoreductase subunit H [Elusimicrobiota bacterium]
METLKLVASYLTIVLLVPPVMLGIINKTKAAVAGRKGPPVLQPLHDTIKLLGKGAVYSETTTWVFRLGPVVSLSAAIAAACLVPLAGAPLVSFNGDAILFAYLFALGRFVTVAAALDTGSSFEGMGASREVAFASLAEPALILAFASLAYRAGELSLARMFAPHGGPSAAASTLLALGSLFVVLLAENSRIPIDDPNTHLELTMIHEVMVLDHGGPDLAFILHGAGLKLVLMTSLLVRLILPEIPLLGAAGSLLIGLAAAAAAIGLVESSMARLRLVRVPQLLVAAICAAAFGLILTLR